MADFYRTFSILPQYRLHATITQGAQSIPGNSSQVSGVLRVEKLTGSGYMTGSSGNSGSISGDISISANGWAPYDFSAYSSRTIGSGTRTVVHNADGTKTAAGSYAANDSEGDNMGSASGSWALGLTAIPRGAVERYNGAGFDSQLLERWDGSAWRLQVLERFDGSSWKRQK